MAKIYLQAGQQFTVNGGPTRVGASATCVDTGLDWIETANYSAPGERLDENDNVVGSIVNSERQTFDVFLERATGRFWYDNQNGY